MLNKMVSSVRHGVLGPDDASRAIHECAALLNLQLASELPVTTVIITGMRKMATATDVRNAFREFGEIEDAAVASKQRGFGKCLKIMICFCFSFCSWTFAHCLSLTTFRTKDWYALRAPRL